MLKKIESIAGIALIAGIAYLGMKIAPSFLEALKGFQGAVSSTSTGVSSVVDKVTKGYRMLYDEVVTVQGETVTNPLGNWEVWSKSNPGKSEQDYVDALRARLKPGQGTIDDTFQGGSGASVEKAVDNSKLPADISPVIVAAMKEQGSDRYGIPSQTVDRSVYDTPERKASMDSILAMIDKEMVAKNQTYYTPSPVAPAAASQYTQVVSKGSGSSGYYAYTPSPVKPAVVQYVTPSISKVSPSGLGPGYYALTW